jgi:hypothetical protein
MLKIASRIINICVVVSLIFIPTIVLANGETSTIEVTVFEDLNQDGDLDEGEPGIGGVTVELFSVDGDPLVPEATETTDGDGNYTFLDLTLGDYRVVETDPTDFVSSTPNEVEVTLTEIPETVYFGDVDKEALGSISGTVFNDVNRNREYDNDDTCDNGTEIDIPLELVTVKLLDSEDIEVGDTATDECGMYEFPELFAGSYTVVETDPTDFSDPANPIIYYSTTPNEVPVELATDGTMDAVVDFGDFIPEEGETKGLDFMLMRFFNIPLLDILDLRTINNWGYGNIARAYFLRMLSGEDYSYFDLLALRTELGGWGNIWKEILGHPGLKGYNLGMIVSDPAQKIFDKCDIPLTQEQVEELLDAGLNTGRINKACREAYEEEGGDFERIKEILGLSIVEPLNETNESFGAPGNGNGNNGNHGPPDCKGKNKKNPECTQ